MAHGPRREGRVSDIGAWRVRAGVAAAVAALLSLASTSAPAAADVAPYQANDFLGFHDVLPPGTNGLANAAGLAAFKATGARPAHNDDQLAMYRDLVYAAPNLRPQDLGRYYKDASFGVRPQDIARTEQPRSDVTIVRDGGFGVPHIYGSTRSGTMFGAGYAAAEDRLFFIDVLRHLGRGQLSSFAGGSKGNRELDAQQLQIAPYTESELAAQVPALARLYGSDGQRVIDDVNSFTDGINAYIGEAKLDPNKMPAEYAAIGRPQGPDNWTSADVISEAALVGGIFGKGGGTQLAWGQILQSFQSRFGAASGPELWKDWREPNDPEAPTTVQNGSFPYQTSPAHPAADSVSLPDPGSLETTQVAGPAPPGSPAQSILGGLLHGLAPAFPASHSNALLVSGAHTQSGHPIAVMGPQVAYFSPQILMEEDMHGPGIDARGAAFAGVNLYVELGRGRDYSWSATSAGQDIVDDFAVDLCNPDGSPPAKNADHYMFRGQCIPMETITRVNSWTPNAADQTPPGSEALTVQRTNYGPVVGRATVSGRPVAYTRLRSTFGHEVDSALGFADFNDPDRIHSGQDFQRAAYRIGYTFNWLYADSRDIAYFNSGNNPVRDPRTDPLLPVNARYEWQGLNPTDRTASYTPFEQHPQVVNQDFITSWNNKQARDYGAADGFFGTVFRSQLLDDRIRTRIAGGRRIGLTDLVNAMEDAGTVDLRADKDLPYILQVIGTPSDPGLASAVAKLRAWVAAGSHRRASSPGAPYDHSDAIAILDAWWPLLVQGEFRPTLGDTLYKQLSDQIEIDNAPNNSGAHLGSAYDHGWYGYVQKDLRDLLAQTARAPSSRHRAHRRRRAHHRRHRRRPVYTARNRRHRHRHAHGRPHRRPSATTSSQSAVLQPYHRIYCGSGSVAACRQMLLSTLAQAIATDRSTLYSDATCAAAGTPGDQRCFDSISFRALGAITQPLIAWVNRPTYQQAVEIQGHR
ncbi:MAG: penicillin acylase family protein [Thermoleophilaceae bacterium]